MPVEINWETDGLALKCGGCGNPVAFGYQVSDEFWRAHAPDDLRLGVLCLPCLDEFAGGIPPEELGVVYYSGKLGTIPLVKATRPDSEIDRKKASGRGL